MGNGIDVFVWGKGGIAANPNQRAVVTGQNPLTETKEVGLVEEDKMENKDNAMREKRKMELER